MVASPPRRGSNAIRLPSGDQFGEPVCLAPNEVSCTSLEPSASETQISLLPVRFESKTIWVPSGEYLAPCCSRDDGVNPLRVRAAY